MIRGHVNRFIQPVVLVDFLLANGDWQSFEVKFDTGFNGELGLSRSLLDQLATTEEEKYTVRLADGSIASRQAYVIEMRVGGDRESRIALDLAAGGELIGMTAFPGWEAHIEIRANGDVRIAPS